MENIIEKKIEIKAPVSKVWRALTDHVQFGEWFRVKLDGPFVVGQPTTGMLLYKGYEDMKWEAVAQKIQPETYFSYTWHPFAMDVNRDYSKETPTLVEFKLAPAEGGTLLVIIESGFEKIPEDRRAEAFRRDEGGWTQQLKNIEKYVTQN